MDADAQVQEKDTAGVPARRMPSEQVLERLRATKASTVYFYLFGLISVLVWFTPHGIWYVENYSFAAWCRYYLVPIIATACMMLASQQVGAPSGADLARRPGRFLALVLAAIVMAYGVLWAAYGLIGGNDWVIGGDNDSVSKYPFIAFFRYAFFFAPLGWLSCLYQQRAADMAKLTALSLKRSALGRELAQSRLLAARAQVDPGLVVRVLTRIQARYGYNAEGASGLMDHLIRYLRLAMNRVRDKAPSPADEMAMATEYLALCAEEIAAKIDLHVDVRGSAGASASSLPLFLIARKAFDAVAVVRMSSLSIHIEIAGDAARLTLGLGVRRPSGDGADALRGRLKQAFPSAGDILHHIAETGQHRYVFEFSVEYLDAHRPDR